MGRSYYIFKSGRLRRKENTLYLEHNAEGAEVERQPIPIEDVRDLYLFGEIDLNTRLITFLAQNKVVVHCFNYYGFYSGSFYPRETNVSGELLVRQVEHYLDVEKRLTIAKQFVDGALFHMRRNLNYYASRGKAVGAFLQQIDECCERASRCTSIPELMREEGHAHEAYYAAFNEILDLEEPFDKRVRRPPNNMINALISFVNTLVYSATLSEIYVTQLNPTVSYLHEPSQRRFSLALDIAEIFKPLVGDRVIFRLLNLGVIDEHSFLGVGEAPGVFLKEEARKAVVREFEESMQTTIYHRRLKRNVSYRQLIRIEAYKLIKHLLGIEPYKPLKAWW